MSCIHSYMYTRTCVYNAYKHIISFLLIPAQAADHRNTALGTCHYLFPMC